MTVEQLDKISAQRLEDVDIDTLVEVNSIKYADGMPVGSRQACHWQILYLLSGKGEEGRRKAAGESRTRTLCGIDAFRRDSVTGNRCMDRNTGSQPSGYEV